MYKKEKAQKGITLIALIITIIVMLILVGVTITMAVNGGLFNYAGNAVSDTNTKLQEEGELAEGGIEVNGVKYDTLEDYLNKIPSTGVKIKLGKTEGTDVEEIPVPEGFTHIEGTKDTGYVITDEVDENGKSIGNEFVWVPVKQGQKITLDIKSETDIKELELYDPYGDLILEVADEDIETTYSNTEIDPTVNGAYFAVTKTVDKETQEEIITQRTITVNSLYALDTQNHCFLSKDYLQDETDFETLEDFALALLKENGFNTIEEGLEYFDVPTIEIGLSKYDAAYWVEVQDAVDYSNSIEKNGGFYIARYEAGATTARTIWNANDSVETIITANGVPVSKEGYAPYYNINYGQALGLAESMYEANDNYEVSLITASGWSRTIGWILETNNKNYEQLYIDSDSWGNLWWSEFNLEKGQYYDSQEQKYKDVSEINNKKTAGQQVLLTTGITSRNSANNIYDFAGNASEFTSTISTSENVTVKCECDYLDTFSAGDLRVVSTNANGGFRPAIYLK